MHRFSLITTGDVFKTRDTYWPSKTIVISILSCNKFGNSQSWTLASTAYHYPFHEGTHWSFSFISTASMKHCLLASHSLLLHTHTLYFLHTGSPHPSYSLIHGSPYLVYSHSYSSFL
jgi:hypothetical protein